LAQSEGVPRNTVDFLQKSEDALIPHPLLPGEKGSQISKSLSHIWERDLG